MTCRQCHYSIGRYIEDVGSVLWCELHNETAEKQCQDFQRDPGTMEREE